MCQVLAVCKGLRHLGMKQEPVTMTMTTSSDTAPAYRPVEVSLYAPDVHRIDIEREWPEDGAEQAFVAWIREAIAIACDEAPDVGLAQDVRDRLLGPPREGETGDEAVFEQLHTVDDVWGAVVFTVAIPAPVASILERTIDARLETAIATAAEDRFRSIDERLETDVHVEIEVPSQVARRAHYWATSGIASGADDADAYERRLVDYLITYRNARAEWVVDGEPVADYLERAT